MKRGCAHEVRRGRGAVLGINSGFRKISSVNFACLAYKSACLAVSRRDASPSHLPYIHRGTIRARGTDAQLCRQRRHNLVKPSRAVIRRTGSIPSPGFSRTEYFHAIAGTLPANLTVGISWSRISIVRALSASRLIPAISARYRSIARTCSRLSSRDCVAEPPRRFLNRETPPGCQPERRL